jgi:hypothetical protein
LAQAGDAITLSATSLLDEHQHIECRSVLGDGWIDVLDINERRHGHFGPLERLVGNL